MPSKKPTPYLALVASLLFLGGCEKAADTAGSDVEESVAEKVGEVQEDVASIKEMAGFAFKTLQLATESCEDVVQMSVREGEGYGVPGVSGAERWGIPDMSPAEPRVRRSWSALDPPDPRVGSGSRVGGWGWAGPPDGA